MKGQTPEQHPDSEIIGLLFDRDEAALRLTDEKYGRLLMQIARSILGNDEDAKETVNDVYLRLWETVPPVSPMNLRAYVAEICRNRALDRLESASAEKRGGGQLLAELDESIPDDGASEIEERALSQLIDGFLRKLPERQRAAFIKRYWFADSLGEISESLGISVNSVKSLLQRTRRKLKAYLEKEGVTL